MFQNFDNPSDPSLSAPRLAKLRQTFVAANVDGFIIPHADEHQGEYLPARAERLSWITGFTGSAGAAIIMSQKAAIFTDGRYTLQVKNQVDNKAFDLESLITNPPVKWLESTLKNGARIGFDPWLHTVSDIRKLTKAVKKAGGELIPVEKNLIDEIWDDQPPAPIEPARIHPIKYAGIEAREKIANLADIIKNNDADCCVLTDPSSIAWAFNIRGSDLPHTPLALSFAILHTSARPQLFIDKDKLDIETHAYLTQLVDLLAPAELESVVADIANTGKTLMLDPELAAHKFAQIVEQNEGKIIEAKDPARLPRAIKNKTEINGTRAAHLRDGAAIAEFLFWLDQQPPGSVDEITIAKKLEACRASYGEHHQMPLRDISFDTISGSGPNGAIVHYRVNVDTNRTLGDGELYLLDSGGQYEDGTTDITRTIAIGEPGSEMRTNNTLVLKGHIAISLARFPKGTRGIDLDVLARNALWQRGKDYAHGTGHGVGSYLAVHEGPQGIHRRAMHELHPGMIISNEPGYYKESEYGIRIENLELISEPAKISGGDSAMLGFETLTLAPLDQRLIDPTLLTDQELHWLNAYHGNVLRQLSPLVDDEVAQWLVRACEPMMRILPPASA
jgi:Xaa-Pro aminopeptidase